MRGIRSAARSSAPKVLKVMNSRSRASRTVWSTTEPVERSWHATMASVRPAATPPDASTARRWSLRAGLPRGPAARAPAATDQAPYGTMTRSEYQNDAGAPASVHMAAASARSAARPRVGRADQASSAASTQGVQAMLQLSAEKTLWRYG